MAITPQFVATVRQEVEVISVGNVNRDGGGTIVSVFAAGSNGSRVDNVRIVASAANLADVVRLFINDGSDNRLLHEELMTATTPSTSVAVAKATINFPDGLLLPSGWSLGASTDQGETYNVFVEGGDF